MRPRKPARDCELLRPADVHVPHSSESEPSGNTVMIAQTGMGQLSSNLSQMHCDRVDIVWRGDIRTM
jgi:hypothetical protein